MMCTTTLNKIREHSPCQDGWKNLLSYVGKTSADDEPVTLQTILESNGLDDALWCLRASDAPDFEIWKFTRLVALDVAHLWDMPAIVNEYLKTGDDTKRNAAQDAAQDALQAVSRAATRNTARTAEWAAPHAARAAAWASQVVSHAEWAASRTTVHAAHAFAWAASQDATWDTAWAASQNTEWAAAHAAEWAAARAAAREIQTEHFISVFCVEGDGATQDQESKP